MKKAKLKRLLEKDTHAIAQALNTFLATQEQDALHKLRVQIKKLRALLVLFAINEKNNKLWQVFKPIRKIFHDAGLIRDSYIHLQLADQFGIKHPTFKEQQAKLMSAETAKFCESGRENMKNINRTGKKLGSELRRIDSTHLTNFYRSELDAIALTLAKREFNAELHECRKQVKNLLYNQKLAAKVLNGDFNINVPYLNQVQEALGRWHDSVSARDLFSTQLPGEQKAIVQLNSQIIAQEKAIARISGNFWKKVMMLNRTGTRPDNS